MKKLPHFKNEDEERNFWATHDLMDVFDERKGQIVTFPNLKPSSKTITLRLPISLLEKIKVEANQRDVPYQSYIKMKLSEVFGVPR
jgi:predicted DNA binding CopG/RHH family protein